MLPAPMNTPAHAVLNLLVLGRRERPELLSPIALGALTPDLPMVWFYFREKVLCGTPEVVIWSESYFAPGWQRLFDLFNSLPLIALGAAVAWALKARGWEGWMVVEQDRFLKPADTPEALLELHTRNREWLVERGF